MTDTEDFMEVLRAKMLEGGIAQPIIDLVASHPDKVNTNYALQDPGDIVLLNNKLMHLREMADQSGISDVSGPVQEPLAGMILQMLGRKG